ncbi:hypothetical protein KP509_07G019700 [Ceratopteris richardii]|uniref:Uncharacterized protein n=1 Tax=Ceratopteris richardii TaxID=49495 RepID=A0A8T2UCH8_CERRI|nr:hypothetical protein KP509_07G019700 [Ceratopteris richardii]
MAEHEHQPEEEEEEIEMPDLPKVIGSLDDLVRQGELSRERAAFARQKIEDLHTVINKSKAVRRKLTNDSIDLSLRLEAEIEILKKEMQIQAEDETMLDLLREDGETAENEALICREKEQALLSEEQDLIKAREDFEKRIKEIEEEHAAALAPQMLQLKLDTDDLRRQIQEGASKVEQCKKEIEENKVKLAQIFSEIGQAQILKKNDFETLSSTDGVPEKLRKQADALLSAVKGLRVQEQRQNDKIKEMEKELDNLQSTKKNLAENHTQSCAELEKFRHLIEQKEVSVSELKKELEMATLEADQYLADRVNYDMQLKSAQLDQKHEQEILAQHLKEKDRALRKLKLLDNQLKNIQEALPIIIAERDKIHHQVILSENEKKKAHASVEEMKKEFDLQMRNYLGIESVSKEVSVNLRRGYKEVERLEKEVLQAIQLEYASHQQMAELASLREHTCRLLSSKLQMFNEAKEKVRTSDIIIGFMKEKHQDIEDHYDKFTKLYNVMRAQRNKSITLIQASKITMAELKDKLKRIEVELTMLQGELHYKDKVLRQMRKEFVSSVQSRSHLRSELIKSSRVLRKQKETIDEKLIEGSRMNGFISTAEKEMSLFRKHYETCVLDRNSVGISLIDRNDELCILYEKSNVQEELFRISDIEMSKRENEISFLKHQVGSLVRSILICYTFVPKAIELRNTIRDLKHELKRVTSESERLSDLVEKPQNTARWKLLHGMDPSDSQLRAKLTYIEETLSKREDESLEKDLILEEISELEEDVKKQAADNLKDSKNTATQITEYQHNIQATTHQMMALVAELSLTQASALSLQKERDALSKIVEEAYASLHAEEVK